MTEKTLVRFAQIRPTKGGPDWVVRADGGGLVLGKLHQPAGDGSGVANGPTDIEIWARSSRIYEQAMQTLAGDTRLLTEPRLSLLLAGGVIMLTGLLLQQKDLVAALQADLEAAEDRTLDACEGDNG